MKDWVEAEKKNINANRASAIQRNEQIYRLAIESKQYKTALDANDRTAKLRGLYTEDIKKPQLPEIITIREKDQSLQLVKDKNKAKNG